MTLQEQPNKCLIYVKNIENLLMNIKVIFSDESGQNLTLVKPTQYDGRSHVKSG